MVWSRNNAYKASQRLSVRLGVPFDESIKWPKGSGDYWRGMRFRLAVEVDERAKQATRERLASVRQQLRATRPVVPAVIKRYPSFQVAPGIIKYYFNESFTTPQQIMEIITERLNDAMAYKGITPKADVQIKLKFKKSRTDGKKIGNKDTVYNYKSFNAVKLENIDRFEKAYEDYSEHARSGDGASAPDQVESKEVEPESPSGAQRELTLEEKVALEDELGHQIDWDGTWDGGDGRPTSADPHYLLQGHGGSATVVSEGAGGCSTRECHPSRGIIKLLKPRASDNNCFFECLGEDLELPSFERTRGRPMTKRYDINNEIRKQFGLEADSMIPISVGLAIYDKFGGAKGLQITDINTARSHYSKNFKAAQNGDHGVFEIVLEAEHYLRVEGMKESPKKCLVCLRLFTKKEMKTSHVCDENRSSFISSVIKKNGRSLICNVKDEDESTADRVIHYDLETYRKPNTYGQASEKTYNNHTPYCCGASFQGQYHLFTGDDCMAQFMDFLFETSRESPGKLFLNAYNGANFDHYFIWEELLRRKMNPTKHAITNGSIVMLEFSENSEVKTPSFACIDLCKHLQGTLSQNLKSFACKIAKGEFDHDKASRWEDMSEDLRKKCQEYLSADVMGLKELYEKLNNSIFGEYKINLSSYISTSSLTYTLWKKSINKKYFIQLPSYEQEMDFRQAVRGGRTYLSKKRFISSEYEDVMAGRKKFEDISDYVVDADVVSLYPTAMAHNMYPTGEAFKYDPEKPNEKGIAGIFKIRYVSNKNCQHSIGGRRETEGKEKGALRWDLKDETEGGWYTSVDIADMIENGYTVEYMEGWYWKTAQPIFKDYIEGLFEKKKQSAKGTPEYALSKLFMNALYGKTIQRPIYSKSSIIKNNSEYWQFRSNHIIKEIEEIGANVMLIGEPRNEDKLQKCISKPTHLGAFILAYSRRIMVNYMKQANPYFASEDQEKRIANDFYYTDTDSLQMHITNAQNMSGFGGKELGCIDDDLGGGKVIRGLWIAPKLYMLEYITANNEIHHHFRGKGLTNDNLSVETFEKLDAGGTFTDTRKFRFVRINVKRNGQQQHIPQFSIVHLDSSIESERSCLTRTVNEKKWAGRKFDGVNSIPHGAL